MAKSKAQRMKEYRERKKQQLGNRWLKIEREQVRAYRQSVQMDPDKKEHERELGRIRQARYRNKNKVNRTLTSDDDRNEPVETPSTIEDFVSSSTDTLTVKLQFTSTKSSSAVKGKNRASRALSDSYRRIETLEDQNEELHRKLKNAQKKLSRNGRKKFERSDLTPRSKADKLIKESGINPDEVPEIRKQLVLTFWII